jgi:hypothetical protein
MLFGISVETSQAPPSNAASTRAASAEAAPAAAPQGQAVSPFPEPEVLAPKPKGPARPQR